MNRPTTTRQAMKRTTTARIAAFALAGTLSALTIAFAMPGGASFVAGKVLPGAGNAFETILEGKARTPFLRFGDRVRLEMLDAQGRSIFGAIDQRIRRPA